MHNTAKVGGIFLKVATSSAESIHNDTILSKVGNLNMKKTNLKLHL
jgi:hypothetical protein